ncbi:MAG TPA: T9SS type A sorting domain-containing protein [Bacteroidia bacterium]|jgi:hypothetical protein|nr:T9SS type A sorting domain-containing protein [Bacteroidia bacterium]
MTFGNTNSNAQGNCASCTTSNYYTVWNRNSNGDYNLRADLIVNRFSAVQKSENKSQEPTLNNSINERLLNIPQEEHLIEKNGTVSYLQASPNPAINSLYISYELSQQSNIAISIFDISGKEVYTHKEGVQMEGKHSLTLDVSTIPNGIYSYSFKAGENIFSQKICIMKQ